MATNTNYNPPNTNNFEKSKLNKYAIGFSFTIQPNELTTFDYQVTDDILMTGGGSFYVKGGFQGDYVDLQVIAPDGQGGWIVVSQFVTSWFINPDNISQAVPKAMYPAKLVAGLRIRIIYHSVGGSQPVWCAINFDFEKVLV